MHWLALSIALALGGPALPQQHTAWRIVDTPSIHVGVRPAAIVSSGGEYGAGATVQITVDVL